MAELKPCPNSKCRKRARLCDRDGLAHVECFHCGLQGPQATDGDVAAKLWNALPREERWVPVSEGLPADRTEVDVYQKTPLREAGHFIRKIRVGLLYENQTFRTPGGRYQVVPFITHWRPHTPPRGPEVTDG